MRAPTSAGSGPIEPVVAFAPGRVNLIGDHTDYTGGLAMPVALHLGTEVTYLPDASSPVVELSSSAASEPARIPLAIKPDPFEVAMIFPEWARFVAGVVSQVHPVVGGKGNVVSDLPLGAGLSSSASLELAVALAVGFTGSHRDLARCCQSAEAVATGVPTGLLDQLSIAFALRGHAMLIDCGEVTVHHVAMPADLEIAIVHCGVDRTVAGSEYAARQLECEAAEREIGPLREATPWDVDRLTDPVVRRRARHVVSENARVRAFASALEHHDLRAAGQLMNDSHQSLAMDFSVSIRELDQLVAWLQSLDGVYGARMTGAGFGGCAVAIARPGTLPRRLYRHRYWLVEPSDGATLR